MFVSRSQSAVRPQASSEQYRDPSPLAQINPGLKLGRWLGTDRLAPCGETDVKARPQSGLIGREEHAERQGEADEASAERAENAFSATQHPELV